MTTTTLDVEDLRVIAFAAGHIIMRHFHPLGVAHTAKEGDGTRVTRADELVNQLVIDKIHRLAPGMPVIAEEQSTSKDRSGYWVLCDPLDGTHNFTHGVRLSVFMIALMYQDEAVANVIYNPFGGDMYYAAKDGGAFLNDAQICVSGGLNSPQWRRPRVAISSWPGCPVDLARARPHFERELGFEVVGYGSAGLHTALVAAGHLDATLFAGESPWDSIGDLLVREAGGVAHTIRGAPFSFKRNPRGHLMAATPRFATLLDKEMRAIGVL